MFELFTNKAIKVVNLSQKEARRLGYNNTGPYEIFLALTKVRSDVASKILRDEGLNLKDARLDVESLIGHGNLLELCDPFFDLGAENVFKNSIKISRNLGHDYVDTEHILLALLEEEEDFFENLIDVTVSSLRNLILVAIRV